ncbi:MAG TPA: DUF6152 family protein [Bryobacteraceae bacterium]
MRYKILGALIGFGLLGNVSLWAHHSPSAEFDMSKRMTLTGTLTKIDWVNPHILFYMQAKGTGEMWKLESNPPAWFRRVGVNRSDFVKAIGQTVTVEGNRSKDGSPFAYILKIIYPDGTSFELVSEGAAAESK